jgi:acyl dehydratase
VPPFMIDRVGEWTDETTFTVEGARTKAYAAATNDPIAAHASGELAPPLFAVVPVWPVMLASVAMVTPPEVMLSVVHGEQDIHFHEAIEPGMTLVGRGSPVGVHVKGSGTTVVTRLETRDASSNKLVNEQYSVTFIRGATDGEGRGEVAPAHAFPEPVRGSEPVAVVDQAMDEDQTYRYSDASGDTVPIHLDADIARSVGLPGIIIHGLCTMAFTSWAAIEQHADGDPRRLRRLAVRFSRPVLPGQTITTRFWADGERDGRAAYVYETTSDNGDVVIKDGVAEIGS